MLNKATKPMAISLSLILKENYTDIFVYLCLFTSDNEHANFIVYTKTSMSLYTVHVYDFYLPITSHSGCRKAKTITLLQSIEKYKDKIIVQINGKVQRALSNT